MAGRWLAALYRTAIEFGAAAVMGRGIPEFESSVPEPIRVQGRPAEHPPDLYQKNVRHSRRYYDRLLRLKGFTLKSTFSTSRDVRK